MAICIGFLSGLELAPVVVRAHAETAVERAPHRLDGAEPALLRDRLELLSARLQPQPRVVDAQGLDVGPWRHADLAAERAGEVALAHASASRQAGHREVRREVRR